MMLALSSGVEIAWWLTLGVGLVVLAVVATLLQILYHSVHNVRRAVDDVLSVGGRLAQNTWTVELLRSTNARAQDLLGELRRGTTGERTGA